MKCFCDIDYNLLTSIIVLCIALITLFVSYRAIRYQIISLINVQLADKAKQCNSNLDPKDLSKPPKKNDKVSGTVSSIITAEEIINYQACLKKSIFIRGFDLQSLIDQFYLQLHTTIRVFLQKGQIYENDIENIENKEQYDTIKNQYMRSIEFLSISIIKDKSKFFEQLHSYSIKRNKKLVKKIKKNGTQHAVIDNWR